MSLNLIKKWFIKKNLLSDKDNIGITKSTALDLDAYIQYRVDNTSGVRPYKVYTALLTQSGTDAPVATVLENTLGGTVVWSYSDVGQYTATLAGVFLSTKTTFQISNNSSGDSFSTMKIFRVDDNTMQVSTSLLDIGTSAYIYSNAQLNGVPIEIRVYP